MSAINRLKENSDRKKITKWLDFINEKDQSIIDEVISECESDKDCRAYFVKRYDDCALAGMC